MASMWHEPPLAVIICCRAFIFKPMAKQVKTKVVYQENYKKGSIINKSEMKRIIDENFDKITMEIKQRTKYSDDTDGIVIEVRY